MFRLVTRLYYQGVVATTGFMCGKTVSREVFRNAGNEDTDKLTTEGLVVGAVLSGVVWPLTVYDILYSRENLDPFRLLPEPYRKHASDAYSEYFRSL